MADVARNASQAFFQNSLAEVVRKLRSQSATVSEADAMETFISDTKKEVSSTVQSVKVAAVQKAMYFQMLGFDSSYANFPIVEVMSDTAFASKRIGYTAACTLFSDDTDVIPLMTALLTRDLSSSNQYEVGLALYCIASVCTPDLARDVVSHVVSLLRHPRTYVRKKAALSLYKVFLQYPDALRPTYPKLKDKLDDNAEDTDTDPAVRGAVVCVLCELARRNPSNFLGLAVPFFSLLQTVHSNWTLIKVVKVFGYFAPLEPRLGKKLMEPLTKLITSSGAKSVQYECLLAVANGMSKVPSLTKLTVEKLRTFAQDRDPNLKYLGLDAISRMVLEHPKLLADQRDTMVATLGDSDPTIRAKALVILRDLVTQSSMAKTVNNMFDACVRTPPEEAWSNLVIQTIVETAQTDDYGLIDDFEWYLGLLFDLSVLNITAFAHGQLLDDEIVTILTRVNGVRAFGVDALAELLTHPALLTCDPTLSTQSQILRAAAFACGEYPHWLKNKRATCLALLHEAVTLLPAGVQLACVTAVTKIVSFVFQPCERHLHLDPEEQTGGTLPEDTLTFDALKAALTGLAAQPSVDGKSESLDAAESTENLIDRFLHSVYPEVQERAKLLASLLAGHTTVGPVLFAKEILAVAAGAQTALSPPEGLNLDEPFNADLEHLLTLSGSDAESSGGDGESDFADDGFDLQYRVEQQRRKEEARRHEMSAFYLGGGDATDGSVERHGSHDGDDIEHGGTLSHSNTNATNRSDAPPARSRYTSRGNGSAQGKKVHAIKRDLQRPEAYSESGNKMGGGGGRHRRSVSPEEDEATRKLRNIDVTRALREDEKLPEAVPYSAFFAKDTAAANNNNNGSGAAKKRTAAAVIPPVVLCETTALRAEVFVEECKAYLEGFRLKCVIEVTNLASSTSLHGVKLVLTSSPAFSADALSWDPPDKRAKTSGADEEETRQVELTVADKVKGASKERTKASLYLNALPASFAASNVPLRLDFTREKRDNSEEVQLPLRYVYFAKHKNHPIDPKKFNEEVLRTMSECGDDLCPTLSAFVPCTKSQLLVAVPTAQQQLFLEPVEVFKDTVSLYGVVHGRKANAESSHVAVMLRETVEDGVKGLSVFAKSYYPFLSEALIHDTLAAILDLKTK